MLRTLARVMMETQISIYNGDCLNELERLNENSIDCIITDPPYELNFMGKGWDNAGVSFNKNTWEKCLRVLKPGGYLLAFGGTRTYHRIACAIEDAGFEIRDCIMWLYGSGFPKSMNIGLAVDKKLGNESKVVGIGKCGKNAMLGGLSETITSDGNYEIKEAQNEWQGWGTALKPAYEPIIVARKSFKGSLVDNVLKNGVGGLNIDECRVEYQDDADRNSATPQGKCTSSMMDGAVPDINDSGRKEFERPELKGRFPANVLLDTNEGEDWRRYFYCAKASKKDRDDGLDDFIADTTDDGRNKPIDNPYLRGKTMRHNTHPTVKPTELMQYLVRLVAPKNAIILDPFMGSGSTGKAVMYENKERNANYKFIGIEKDVEYCNIAKARIEKARGGQWKLV